MSFHEWIGDSDFAVSKLCGMLGAEVSGSPDDRTTKELFGSWEEPRPYIRIVPQPS